MITKYSEFILEVNYNDNTESDPEFWGIHNYKWNNGKLDCFQDVVLEKRDFKKLPFIFGEVKGRFYCRHNQFLENLEGAPDKVNGFYCSFNNSLKNMVGCPSTIDHFFACTYNNSLTSLEGCPETVYCTFNCEKNSLLTSLVGCPKNIEGFFNLKCNDSLISLDGCPKKIKYDFNCHNNPVLKHLDYFPEYVGYNFCIFKTPIKSIEDYPRCIIKAGVSKINNFRNIFILVQKNPDIFIPLFDNKIAFHQMVMRLRPDLIKYYKTIQPPTKKSIL